jgi:2-oxo-3-hexenedioate decarboxylase
MREACGEMPVGRKIGFTNRTIWAEYNVYGPIWGYVYNGTVQSRRDRRYVLAHGLAEPRIEPEIVFKLALVPAPGMDETALLGRARLRNRAVDLSRIEVFRGRHGRGVRPARALLIGPCHSIAAHGEDWSWTLSTFEIDLKCDGAVVDHGRATNVLGGPVSALRNLVDILARDQINPPLAAGEIITTGTLTRALPVSAGETWTTKLTGVAFDGICVRFPWVMVVGSSARWQQVDWVGTVSQLCQKARKKVRPNN